jgi:hypothetical protein
VLDVCEVVIAVDIDSMDLNFVSRACDVDHVLEDENFFLAGNTTRRNSAWRLLNR